MFVDLDHSSPEVHEEMSLLATKVRAFGTWISMAMAMGQNFEPNQSTMCERPTPGESDSRIGPDSLDAASTRSLAGEPTVARDGRDSDRLAVIFDSQRTWKLRFHRVDHGAKRRRTRFEHGCITVCFA